VNRGFDFGWLETGAPSAEIWGRSRLLRGQLHNRSPPHVFCAHRVQFRAVWRVFACYFDGSRGCGRPFRLPARSRADVTPLMRSPTVSAGRIGRGNETLKRVTLGLHGSVTAEGLPTGHATEQLTARQHDERCCRGGGSRRISSSPLPRSSRGAHECRLGRSPEKHAGARGLSRPA